MMLMTENKYNRCTITFVILYKITYCDYSVLYNMYVSTRWTINMVMVMKYKKFLRMMKKMIVMMTSMVVYDRIEMFL